MCGIFGGYSLDLKIKKLILNRMSHRGPDNSGYYMDENKNTLLCHTRLSIIDQSDGGSQPMSDKNKKYFIIFNGEIYNYIEIKKKLLAKGYTFESNSDTEIVLYSFIEWGEKCLDLFRGMFAFCIYLKNQSSFFLARDRFGIKPLVYFYDGHKFYFSSEIKTFSEIKDIKKTLNNNGIMDFFYYGSISQPNTIYNEFKFLPPGHYLQCGINQKLQIFKYYDLEENVKNNEIIENKNEANEILNQKFNEVAKYNLVADVEVSSFLSGGLDSSLATYLVQKFSDIPISSYCVLFDEYKNILNESLLSSKIAKFLGTNHKILNVNSDMVKTVFDEYINCIDQPSIDGFNTFVISKEVSKYHKVAISGIGGDEIFGGYSFYKNIVKYSNQKNSFSDKVLSYINKLRPNRFTNHFQLKNQVPEKSILEFRKIHNFEKFLNLKINNEDKFKSSYNTLTTLQRVSIFEIKNYMNNTLLRDSDIFSMANSLEIRPIFLDHKLIEFALSIPDSFKIEKNIQKKIIREFLKDKLPKEVFESEKKGFEFPYLLWMNGILNQKFIELLNNREIIEIINFYFSKKFIERLNKRAQKKNLNSFDWSIFIFICWYEKNFF